VGALLGGELGVVEGSGRELVDLRVQDIRDVGGTRLEEGGFFAGEEFVDGGGEELQPARELGRSHGGQRDEPGVGGDGVAREIAGAEEDRFPKGIHLRQVRRPIGFGDVVEDKADEFVLTHFAVEGIDQSLDVRTAGEVGTGGGGWLVFGAHGDLGKCSTERGRAGNLE